MSQQQVVEKKKDEHDEHDVVMPGFRFHPTEEELIEFYLRRKVEGKRFHVELVTFLDLYHYDPWELPAMAAIGEKEWFFYVPRDRKYRNGDRPNRVTTSGYWKATGADRTIKTEDLRTIGLRKTLVFYSGKAPKGVRSSWIMNEYRLPTHETERLQTAEISLCRVYKRTVVIEDHSSSSSSLPRSLPAKAASSTSSSPRTGTAAAFKKSKNDAQNQESAAMERFQTYTYNATNPHQVMEEKQMSIFPNPCFVSSSQNVTDDLHRLVNFQHHPADHLLPSSQPQLHSHSPLSLSMLTGSFQAALSDRIWDWSSVTNDFHTSFK